MTCIQTFCYIAVISQEWFCSIRHCSKNYAYSGPHWKAFHFPLVLTRNSFAVTHVLGILATIFLVFREHAKTVKIVAVMKGVSNSGSIFFSLVEILQIKILDNKIN